MLLQFRPEIIECHSDSDWGSSADGSKSTSGGVLYYRGAILDNWSRAQHCVVLCVKAECDAMHC